MNNIVERLHVTHQVDTGNGYYETVCDPLRTEAADLIESLQAKVDILTESAENWRDNLADRTNELTAATKRIAELEAELEANLQQRVRMQHTINQYESGDKVSKYYACPDCAALRKRIAELEETCISHAQIQNALRDELAALHKGIEDATAQAHRLALELECLLLSCNDNAAVSKWWDSAHEALAQWKEFRETEPVAAEKHGCHGGEGATLPQHDPIKTAVDRFLGWKLPENFAPDCHITFDAISAIQTPNSWPIGTNLFTADQAKMMFEHCLEGTGYVVFPEAAKEREAEPVTPTNRDEALHLAASQVHAWMRLYGINNGDLMYDELVRLIDFARNNSPAPKAEPVAWLHRQGNFSEPSCRQLDEEELSRGWTQEPLFTTPQPQVPEGWQLVPVDPTPDMLAVLKNWGGPEERNYVVVKRRELYKAMLAAAPKKEGE